MQRLRIMRGIERNARTFMGRSGEAAFSVTRTDYDLYLAKFFMSEDRFYTEKEWRTILRRITAESEMLKGFYRNLTGMDYTGADFRSMLSYDARGKKEDDEWPGQEGLLSSIILFYERFILFAGLLIGNDKVNMILSRAA